MVTGSERRLQAEWDLLQELAQLNPGRLSDISAEDRMFRVTLHEAPARLAHAVHNDPATVHRMRVLYPLYFPAVPLELYVDDAFQHPNVHPETGFVCLWDRHRGENTVEHALHKVVAMMDGRLYNREALHLMQPEALAWIERQGSEGFAPIRIKPLLGIAHDTFALDPSGADRETRKRRHRLS